MNTALVLTIAAIVVGVVKILDFFGYLPTKKSAIDAAGELTIAAAAIARKDHELEVANARADREHARAERLAQERSNEPVLELVRSVFETQQTTLDKLGQFNGALKRNEEGLLKAVEALDVTSEGLKALTSTIAELHDLPMRPPANDPHHHQEGA